MNSCKEKYKEYLENHISNVKLAYDLLLPSIKNMQLRKQDLLDLETNIAIHDKSKFLEDEFIPYSNYFYGDKSEQTTKDFKNAVILHKQRNPHHIEYWQGKDTPPPTIYLVEMVCDWWAFSLQNKKPKEIFDWYNNNKAKLHLSNYEETTINYLLDKIAILANELKL